MFTEENKHLITHDRATARKCKNNPLTSISRVPLVSGEKTKLTPAAGVEQLVSEVVYARAKATKPSKSESLKDIMRVL